jgi:hypothetical protein
LRWREGWGTRKNKEKEEDDDRAGRMPALRKTPPEKVTADPSLIFVDAQKLLMSMTFARR